jgi:hypothetical protein
VQEGIFLPEFTGTYVKWLMPDDKSKPSQFHFDPDRTGKSSIVVHSNPNTGKWETSIFSVTGLLLLLACMMME